MQTSVQSGMQGARGSSSLQCYRCLGGGHMARGCATPAMQLNREGGTQGNAVKPPSNHVQQNPKIPSVTPSQNQPRIRQKGWKGITPIPFLNPDLVALIRHWQSWMDVK